MKIKSRTVFAVSLTGALFATLLAISNSAFADQSPPTPSSSSQHSNVQAEATMTERLFPNGVSDVVLCSGSPSQAGNVQLAQALATKLSGALLLTENSQHLGLATKNALTSLSTPQVAPSGTVQPFQPQPGKPMIYLVGDYSSISASLETRLTQMGYQVTRLGGSPNTIRNSVLNMVAPALPQGTSTQSFPTSWNQYEGASNHESFFPASSNSPAWIKNGVSWSFAEQAAVPLNATFPDLANLGLRNAPVKLTQYLGNAVGVTAVNGIIYAESDDYHLYALNAQTGALLWQVGPLNNSLMGNPIVSGNIVYVTTGDTGFSFSQVLKFEQSSGTSPLVRGLLYSSLYAFNATTGRMIWRQDFKGNAMPTPILYNNTVYEPTGGGNLWALNAQTGALRWKTPLGGFDSMSSPNLYVNPTTKQASIVVGTSDANHVVAVNAKTGAVTWTQPTTLNIFNTGMGDNSPVVDQSNGIVVQDSVVNFDRANKTTNLAVYAMNASTGKVLWSTNLGRSSAPPAYKGGMALIQNGVVYVGSPVTSELYALNESNGKILWSFPFVNSGPAGAGRGNPVLAYGVLWIAAGPTIYAIDPSNGKELSSYTPGGRFGIVNPVIVGGTMYLGNSYDWIQAIPLTKIYPSLKISS